MRHTLPTLGILGVPVVKATSAKAIAELERLADEAAPVRVSYVNAHTLNLVARETGYREVIEGSDIVLNDGAGVAVAARLSGDRFPENLNGSDFNPRILELAARKGWKVYFLGGAAGVAEAAAARLQARIPGLEVVGVRDGYFPRSDDPAVAAEVQASGAEVVMAAMGNPLQEVWLAQHLAATGARLGVGVGAFFDFAAERVKRSPAWMNRAGIEWVWRLAQEPGRLWRRYVLGNPAFLWRVLRQRLKRR